MSELTREEFEKLKSHTVLKSRVISESMEPVIKIGDEVVVDVGNLNLEPFDIVVIYLNQKLVCHYLWRKNQFVKPILYQTRSMLKKMDMPVTEDLILGKVISHKIGFWRKLRLLY